MLSTGSQALSSNTNQRIEEPVRQSINTRQATQKAEEKWRFEKEKLAAKFEQLRREQERLQEQKSNLQQQVETTQKRIVAKKRQLDDIEQIANQIRPFLDKLVKELGLQIADGLPFLTAERRQRIDKLESLMVAPDISISEKYRKVMEALLVEAEYGFTIEAKQETIEVEGQNRLVNIFRLGRLSLFYQDLDQKACGFYNVVDKNWQTLPANHNREIQKAIDIAAKRRPVELLNLPLGKMVSR
jgi:DNA repair exonuclease SbcCD ATPase subunit